MNKMDRRRFLTHAAGAAAGLLTGACAYDRSMRTRPGRALPPTDWRKHGVILEGTEPWEGNRIQNFTSPAEPLDGGRWRFWYSPRGGEDGFTLAYAEGVPGEPMRKFPAHCTPGQPVDAPFALGHLPEAWKPTQVIHIHLRDGRHRIYFWAHGGGKGGRILRFLAADSDDGRRYRVVDPHRPVLYHPHDRAACGIPTPDDVLLVKERTADLPAGEPYAPSELISNDATNVYQLPDGSFEMYSVGLVPVPREDPAYIAHDNAPGLLRMIDRYTSDDGLRFGNRTRVIVRDAADPVDLQFYYLAVTYTPAGRVGMLGRYLVEAQTMDLEWCFSKNGLTWERPLRRAWLPRGDRTQPDCYGIYASHNLVQRDGRYHLFYTGVNSAHNGRESFGPPRSVIMHATIDGIV